MGALLAACLPVLMGSSQLGLDGIEGLDQAHHLMDGLFLNDLVRGAMHGAWSSPIDYLLAYQARYPALGFQLWPPLFPLAEAGAFLLFGDQLLTARWTLLGFGALFGLFYFLVLESETGSLPALCATAVCVTNTFLMETLRTLQLEIPALALALATLWACRRVGVRGRWAGGREVVALAVLAAAVPYTKQPLLFALLPAFGTLGLSDRRLWIGRTTLQAVGLVVLLLLPLAVFTWKFGQVNLAQSLGNQGGVYGEQHHVAQRWTWEAWSYYPLQLWASAPRLVLLVLAGSLVLAWRRRLPRAWVTWLVWIVSWFLLFGFFDNKQPRFLTSLIPALVAVVAYGVAALPPGRIWLVTGCAPMLALAFWGGTRSFQPREISLVRPALERALEGAAGSRFAYHGDYRAAFVAEFRLQGYRDDRALARLDRLTAVAGTPEAACRAYGIRRVLVEEGCDLVLSERFFRLAARSTFRVGPRERDLLAFDYLGPRNAMSEQLPTLRVNGF